MPTQQDGWFPYQTAHGPESLPERWASCHGFQIPDDLVWEKGRSWIRLERVHSLGTDFPLSPVRARYVCQAYRGFKGLFSTSHPGGPGWGCISSYWGRGGLRASWTPKRLPPPLPLLSSCATCHLLKATCPHTCGLEGSCCSQSSHTTWCCSGP